VSQLLVIYKPRTELGPTYIAPMKINPPDQQI